MYTLYYLPDACSLATQVILRELKQPFDLIDKRQLADFRAINPVGTVPVLIDSEWPEAGPLREAVAILLHVLNKHENTLLPQTAEARQQSMENLLFANATMHPSYGRLFFIAKQLDGSDDQQAVFDAAATAINALWSVVEQRLANQTYLGGKELSPADVLLAVYSRWSEHFPIIINIGPETQRMLNAVMQRESFQQALQAEQKFAQAS